MEWWIVWIVLGGAGAFVLGFVRGVSGQLKKKDQISAKGDGERP